MRLRFGDCLFDGQTRELHRNGRLVHLQPKVFSLLEILLSRRPGAVSKDELMDTLWPGTFVADGNLARGEASYILIRDEQEIALREGENILGRDPAADVPVEDTSVSRHHARIVIEGVSVHIEDLGSKNG